MLQSLFDTKDVFSVLFLLNIEQIFQLSNCAVLIKKLLVVLFVLSLGDYFVLELDGEILVLLEESLNFRGLLLVSVVSLLVVFKLLF